MKTMLLSIIACTCFSLAAMEKQIIPIQPSSNPPAYTPGLVQDQPPSITITHSSQPSQENHQPQSSSCKTSVNCAVATAWLIPACLLDTLISPFLACANELTYREDPIATVFGDPYEAPDDYICINQYSLTKALLNVACDCKYDTCVTCPNDENASN